MSDLWTVFLVAAAIVGGLVWGLITFAIIRYRRRASDVPSDTPRPEFRHALPLEIAWTTGPILIVLFLFVMTLFALQRIDAREGGAVNVNVEAFRWQWRFDISRRRGHGDRDAGVARRDGRPGRRAGPHRC